MFICALWIHLLPTNTFAIPYLTHGQQPQHILSIGDFKAFWYLMTPDTLHHCTWGPF